MNLMHDSYFNAFLEVLNKHAAFRRKCYRENQVVFMNKRSRLHKIFLKDRDQNQKNPK